MYVHLGAITIAEHCVRLLLQRAVCLQRKRELKNTYLERGEGRTSDLLKYSWGFLHFNLLLFKRWLFPMQTAPGGKRFPAPGQSWTNVGWEPLRASGLLTDGLFLAGQLNTFGPALVP